MKNLYAVWIDHERAVIVKANPMGDMTFSSINSEIEPHRKSTVIGGDQFTISNQNKKDERRSNEMHDFTKEILTHLSDADEIMVCGPSTAKFDLKHAIENSKPIAGKLTKVETCHKMSEGELKNYVMETMHLPRD